jgi:hypothetical protein
MEFFRDEMDFGGTLSERQWKKFRDLRDLCDSTLDNPSVADADRIRAAYRHEVLATNGMVKCGRCGTLKPEGTIQICCM